MYSKLKVVSRLVQRCSLRGSFKPFHSSARLLEGKIPKGFNEFFKDENKKSPVDEKVNKSSNSSQSNKNEKNEKDKNENEKKDEKDAKNDGKKGSKKDRKQPVLTL